MPVTPTYPGVYVQEVPSGVRTIVGVSTSTAVFIGRAKRGPMNEPVLCLSLSDFERAFTGETAGSDMARHVRLFFQNGGTRCYGMRIAKGAKPAQVTLKSESGAEVLEVTARSAGLEGNKIRIAVTYNGLRPEATFNLEIFRWGNAADGTPVKEDRELFSALSMDPASPRYVERFVNQSSQLVEVKDKSGDLPPGSKGFSRSGRPFSTSDANAFRTEWQGLIGTTATTNRFRISVKGGGFTDIRLSNIDFDNDPDLDTGAEALANLADKIEGEINKFLPTDAQVEVSLEAGPTDSGDGATVLLQIAAVGGDILVEPAAASTEDLAAPLMLGTAQGGVEVGFHAGERPAPTARVFDLDDLVSLAGRKQNAFNTITLGGAPVALGTDLQTTGAGDAFFEDGLADSVNGNNDGVREKLAILAGKINDQRLAEPDFPWSAEVWGSRLALILTAGGDNQIPTVVTTGAGGDDIGGNFHQNVRYYSLGSSGGGGFQTPGQDGDPGTAPELADYRDAFEVLRKEVDLFNLMILPGDQDHTEATARSVAAEASVCCRAERAFLLMDAPASWQNVQQAISPTNGVNKLRLGLAKDHSALFYPRVTIRENGLEVPVGPSGAIAGLMARIDGSRGVWKAPAGTEADLRGVVGLERRFSDAENGLLNPRAINTLRIFPEGIVNWGARTMDGDDDFGSEWKYIPVRRLALFLEESLYRGLKWVVFEPNDEPLWAQIRLNVGAFMHNLFRQGAFQGQKPKDAYFVKCDRETTTQNDVNLGMVNIWVGFAPLKPAEFVILYLQQMAGQIQV